MKMRVSVVQDHVDTKYDPWIMYKRNRYRHLFRLNVPLRTMRAATYSPRLHEQYMLFSQISLRCL